MTEQADKIWPKRTYVRKPCGFTGCGRDHYARGLCNGHYQQKRRGDALEPLPAVTQRRVRPVKPCKFNGCDRRRYGAGLCSTHYMQQRRGYELKPIRSPRPDAAEGLAWCTCCKQFRDETEFSWDFKRQEQRYWCRPCTTAKQHEYFEKAGPGVIRHRRRLRRRGITPEQFDYLLAEQNGKCAICRKPGDLHIDHCHASNEVRGLLCGPCNRALGLVRDDVTILRSAIAYLERGNHVDD